MPASIINRYSNTTAPAALHGSCPTSPRPASIYAVWCMHLHKGTQCSDPLREYFAPLSCIYVDDRNCHKDNPEGVTSVRLGSSVTARGSRRALVHPRPYCLARFSDKRKERDPVKLVCFIPSMLIIISWIWIFYTLRVWACVCEQVLLGFVHGCGHVCLCARLRMATAAPSVCAETLSINQAGVGGL